MNISCESAFAKYFVGECFQLYLLLKGPDYTEEVGYEECKQLKRQVINQYVSNCDLEMFKKLIDVCNDISEFDDHTSWEVGEGLGIAFDAISFQKDCYVDAIRYYIEKDTPSNLHLYYLMNILFSLLSDSEVYQIIARREYSQKNAWLYAYYHELPPELITQKHLHGLYSFLEDNCNLELLEEIYCVMLSNDNHSDYNGQFLKEIYLVRPSILDKYIGYLINKNNGSFSDHQERHRCFFDLDDFIEIYNKIFEQLIRNCQFSTLSVPHFLESLLLPAPNKQNLLERQDEWIRQCIQMFSNDETKIYCLFSVISKSEIERKKEYVLLFLENNPLFEDFERIPLTPTSWSWSGSAVPIYSSWIKFLESLLPSFIGLKWIKHKNYIETQIGYFKERIESEQIETKC